MARHEELLKAISEMPEDKAKDLLAEILVDYGDRIYGTNNGDEAFLRRIKTIYLKLSLEKHFI